MMMIQFSLFYEIFLAVKVKTTKKKLNQQKLADKW